MTNEQIRNVAIIAHVDHGKTTLVDQMLKQGGAFRSNQVVAERVMDSNALERERGITILAKNTSVKYGNYKINVVDTPGHADFGGEVERILKMVNGVVLLVDAYEGTMPQTRFVLSKALELGHRVIVVVNKIDRPDRRVSEVCDEVIELLMELNATDEQLDSPIIYCSGRNGTATVNPDEPGTDLIPLFETIVRHIPAPSGDASAPVQMLVSALDYSEYVGAIGIGRIERGTLRTGMNVLLSNYHTDRPPLKAKVTNIYQFEGLNRVAAEEATVGDIVCVSGVEGVSIGDTLCDPADSTPIEFPKISEPSVEMTFSVNDSPFAGKEGKFVTSRHLRARLYKEAVRDVSIRVSDTDTSEAFRVCGRGEMHLSILIENMRREGYEFQVSMPRVLFKEEDGVVTEPIDLLIADVPSDCVGVVMEKMGVRKGELKSMTPIGERMRLEFEVPSRGLFGYKSEFLTDTKGEGILTSVFEKYDSYRGEIDRRPAGSLIAFETGEAVGYGLFNAQDRGTLFIGAGTKVYEGMIVGENPKGDDIAVNVCKRKQMTNMRASGSDDALRLTPHKVMSLEQSLDFIADDELLEVTPSNIRIRKKILNAEMRAKAKAHAKK
ncbi:translational GTPase TypA [Pumilibacter intestinalis]|jgi:GTP-binding protein|uniref:translational GTPase TypA n=1 Tax=Pumilibacter intestinalis TaxID=2941511 RepID=UPI00203DDE5A|nr:translational GTPase TypA [Pumilibacter intestinalis]MCI8488126.1 translational GTPase TypA [Clostridia bacterium]